MIKKNWQKMLFYQLWGQCLFYQLWGQKLWYSFILLIKANSNINIPKTTLLNNLVFASTAVLKERYSVWHECWQIKKIQIAAKQRWQPSLKEQA